MSLSSSSSGTSSDTEFLRETMMIGDAMKATLAYIEADEAESSLPETRAPPLKRNRVDGHDRLIADYFADDAIYAVKFRRRFRMRKELFLRIVEGLSCFPYFTLRYDGRRRIGFSAIQKCTAAIRQLAYGMGSDTWDEYLRMSERTIRESCYKFALAIIRVYGARYMRKPTPNDLQRLYHFHENKHGFPGMLGSLDCMHWQWGSCPNAWRRQFTRGDQKGPTIILEAVASQDLHIWHSFFGCPGSMNDINVLEHSKIFNNIYQGTAHELPFQVNHVDYKRGYYLTDGIYPEYGVFVKSYTCPNDPKRLKFKGAQEAARKDIERAFGVLKRRFQILKVPARSISRGRIQSLMYCCIILHNMILEDEGKAIAPYDENEIVPVYEALPAATPAYMANREEVQSRVLHQDLRADLVEHIFQLRRTPVVEPVVDLYESSDDESEMFDSDGLSTDDDDDEIDLNN